VAVVNLPESTGTKLFLAAAPNSCNFSSAVKVERIVAGEKRTQIV
jgi:hypothetical protein